MYFDETFVSIVGGKDRKTFQSILASLLFN
jgi:hypothetical protein